jgi:hypothetical protein
MMMVMRVMMMSHANWNKQKNQTLFHVNTLNLPLHVFGHACRVQPLKKLFSQRCAISEHVGIRSTHLSTELGNGEYLLIIRQKVYIWPHRHSHLHLPEEYKSKSKEEKIEITSVAFLANLVIGK